MNSITQIKPSKDVQIKKCKELGISTYTNKTLEQLDNDINKKFENMTLDNDINKKFENMTLDNDINKNISENMTLDNDINKNIAENMTLENDISAEKEKKENDINKNIEENMRLENDISKMTTEIKFNNQYVLSRMEENKLIKNSLIIQELKQIVPLLSDVELLQLYNKSISIHQSKIQGNGNFLENDILVGMLDLNNIPYKKQVTINKSGIIVGFNEKKGKCYHIIDFVIGENIEVGKSITEYKVISCKTTCRERWTQDDWSYTFIPKLYILLTISDDYPPSARFREDIQRKIITCIPKRKDDRIYKLNFENLIEEL